MTPRPLRECIGRRLTPAELITPMVVILQKACGHQSAITAWATFVGPEAVAFYMGATGINLLLARDGEKMTDDTGTEIMMYEFTGNDEHVKQRAGTTQ